jgi:hypothetical protein
MTEIGEEEAMMEKIIEYLTNLQQISTDIV